MQVDVDFNKCQSNGLCVLMAPEVFDLDDNGYLQFDANPDESLRPAVEDAVASCPVSAITLTSRP